MRNIVITGASSGIGLGLTDACVALGDRVLAIDLYEPEWKLTTDKRLVTHEIGYSR